jgi:Ohr subfamily peroxiredoxin
MIVLYAAHACATGGEDGVLSIAEAGITLRTSTPPALGGAGVGVNPEQLVASGFATCFLRALRTVAKRRKVTLSDDSSVEATIGIGVREDAPGFDLSVTLAVRLPGLADKLAGILIEEADDVCPLSHLAHRQRAIRVSLA